MNKSTRSSRLLRYYLFRTRRLTRRQLGTLEDWKMRVVFWIGALLVGLVIVSLTWATKQCYTAFTELRGHWPYIPVVLTPSVMLFSAWIMRRGGTASQGSGIPQVLVVLKQRYHWLRPAFLSLRVIVLKFGLTCLGLFGGASIGREGPSVHIGAAVMYSVGRLGRLKQKSVDNALIVAGGAAGVSAAFNTPLAGIMFAIEELSGSFEQRSSGTLIVSIFLSGVVVLALVGHYSVFGQPAGTLDVARDWMVIVVTGLVCGVLGGLFGRLLIMGCRFLAPYGREHPYRVVFLCSLAVVFLGLISGGTTFGSGYEEARHLLQENADVDYVFPIAKMAATLASYFSGLPGGLFSPSLAAGAGIGNVIGHLMPNSSMVGVTLVAMAAFLAAVLQRPITSFVIVMELTGNRHEILLPLMAGAFLAAVVSRLVWLTPLYDSLGERLQEGEGMALDDVRVDPVKAADPAR